MIALVDALHRIGHHDWPLHVSPLVRAQLEQTAAALGHKADLTTDDGVLRTIAELGDAADVAMFTVRASTTPTVVRAGYKVNVIPGLAEAEIDVRCPPGFEDELLAALPGLVGDCVSFEHSVQEPSVQAPIDGAWFDAMVTSIRQVDPVCCRRARLPRWRHRRQGVQPARHRLLRLRAGDRRPRRPPTVGHTRGR